jgi:hypothetical protein
MDARRRYVNVVQTSPRSGRRWWLPLVLVTLVSSSCTHYYENKALPPNFQSTATGKRIAVVWLRPSYLWTPKFYWVMKSAEEVKTAQDNRMGGWSAIMSVRHTFYAGGLLYNAFVGRSIELRSNEYIWNFLHTMSIPSLTDRWRSVLIPKALKDYGFQVVRERDYKTEDIRGRSIFGSDVDFLRDDLTYEFKDLPESEYLFVIELLGVGVFHHYRPDDIFLGGTAIYGSLLESKTKKVLWQHLSIAEEPSFLGENGQPVHSYPSRGEAKERVSTDTIQAAVGEL